MSTYTTHDRMFHAFLGLLLALWGISCELKGAAAPAKKEVALRILNVAPVTVTVRYATSQVPALTETVAPNTVKTIERDPTTPLIYSFEGHTNTFPITSDMIAHGETTIKPIPLETAHVVAQPQPSAAPHGASTAGQTPAAPTPVQNK